MTKNRTLLTGRILKEKAIELCKSAIINGFKASNGYILNFLTRISVKFAIL